MSKQISARADGWVVKDRFVVHGGVARNSKAWHTVHRTYDPEKSQAINKYGRRFYTDLRRMGYARCVRVYVEEEER